MKRRAAAAVLAGLLCALPARLLADGVVRVHVVRAQRGVQPVEVLAYGEAAPKARFARSISQAQMGQVLSVAVVAGQRVRRGDLLLRFVVAPSAVAQYQKAATDRRLAESAAAHVRELLGLRLATRDQAAAAEKAALDARSVEDALAREGAKTAVVNLRAPFDGLVQSIAAAPGERPAAGAVLASLLPLEGVQVTVGVEPERRGEVHAGQGARLEPLSGGPGISGKVLRVDQALNPKTRLVDVDIQPSSGSVLLGQAFRASISVGQAQGWLAPHEAVRVEDNRAFVFQLAGRKAVRVPVMVRLAGREVDVVEGAIRADRPLVTLGAYQVDEGGDVQVER